MNDPASQTTSPEPDVADLREADAAFLQVDHLRGSRSGNFQVIIRDDVLDEIHAHGKTDTSVEICGVMVGQLCRDRVGNFLHVTGSIRGATAGHKSQVTFTAETWEKIGQEKDEKYPDAAIVGWYHTHPGFGVFLSGMDFFIQDNFFNLPQQIAWVYDPIKGEDGVFVWRGGKSVREPHLVEGQSGIDWHAIARTRTDPDPRPKRHREWSMWTTLVMFAISFALAFVVLRYVVPMFVRVR